MLHALMIGAVIGGSLQAASAGAQTAPSAGSRQPPPSGVPPSGTYQPPVQTSPQGPQTITIGPDGKETTPPGSTDAAKEHKPLTKDQAKELFKSVDDILAFVSKDTDLPIKSGIKKKLLTRDEVNKYLREKFNEDKSTKRLERSEVVLKKFGLLDPDFQLGPFMISLLTEQVAGFYDNKTKTVNLLDWVDPDDQQPVLAHELTHALQDQKVGLTKWSEVGSDDIAKNVAEDNAHIQTDEGDTARDAVTEGQAMAVYLDWELRKTGRTLADVPGMMDKMKDTVADTSGSPIMARAPLLLQKSLLFPYDQGLGFEDAILIKKGKDAAFGGVLDHPPSSTMEIMHPAAYMAHTAVPVLRLPDIHPLIEANYLPYDVGVMGEFDVEIVSELFGGKQLAAALTPQWNGGIYYAAQKRSATTPEAKRSRASIGLLYYSRWRSQEAALRFMRMYADELPRKYSGLSERKKDEADATEQVYSTSEGDVLLSLSDDGVFISEGFPLELGRKLRDKIVSVQSDAPLQVTGVDRRGTAPPASRASEAAFDPGLAIARTMADAGVMKAAIAAESVASGRYTLGQR
ncbi:MAG TPA: hypothetical protein VN612_17305 [Acidobacteriaceae bacterium]|nr:hypothetical protein [Acidobacteriaceae bacterium]